MRFDAAKAAAYEPLGSTSGDVQGCGAGVPRLTCSAIIVSYKTREMTLGCLRRLALQLNGPESEIWVVDNDSRDGTVEAIASEFPQVKLIVNAANHGFGAANNTAMRQARGKYLLLLNSDAFVAPSAIDELLRVMSDDPRIAVVGPRLLNEDGSLQLSCFRFPSPAYAWGENLGLGTGYRRWRHDRERDVDWVTGACMLVRREAFEQIGGFDERFFLYAEETDLQRRMRSAGWKVRFTPAAHVVHLGRGSSTKLDAGVDSNFFKSLDLYELKHHGVSGALAVRAAMVVGCAMRAALWSVVALCNPASGAPSRMKARRHAGLVVRQLTHRLTRVSKGATA